MANSFDIIAVDEQDEPQGYLMVHYGNAHGNIVDDNDGCIITMPHTSTPITFNSVDSALLWLDNATVISVCNAIDSAGEPLESCDTLVFTWHAIHCLNDEPLFYARCIDDEWDIIDY